MLHYPDIVNLNNLKKGFVQVTRDFVIRKTTKHYNNYWKIINQNLSFDEIWQLIRYNHLDEYAKVLSTYNQSQSCIVNLKILNLAHILRRTKLAWKTFSTFLQVQIGYNHLVFIKKITEILQRSVRPQLPPVN